MFVRAKKDTTVMFRKRVLVQKMVVRQAAVKTHREDLCVHGKGFRTYWDVHLGQVGKNKIQSSIW